MKSIIIATNYSGPYEGNFIRSIRKLNEELKEKSINLILVFPEETLKYEWTKTLKSWCNEVVFINAEKVSEYKKIAKIIKENNVIFVHTHFATFKLLTILRVANIFSGKKIPIIEHWHNHWSVGNNKIKEKIKKNLVSNDRMIACSEGVAESLRKANLKNKIIYIKNAIDFSRFNIDEISLKEKDIKPLQVLIFGFDFERKGVDLAIRACFDMVDKGIKLNLKICVAIGIDEVKGKILNLIGEDYIPEWIELLPPTDNIQEYYEQATVFISPSREEGFPYSLIEAAYCGCLLIASNISGQNEIDFKDVLWISSESEIELEKALEKINTMDSEKIKEMSYEIHKEAQDKYQIERWTRDVINYYRSEKLI
ncbi:glycosyltransferase family 4 protein [uncultured Eubacterium sp.]|uniref:glycosyltransferase family 4 protein n=1 Tax=uncultured Eubacterium sp. TaxID=165185 RepID=UPI0026DDC8A6|nr:glycosyltransferase family 4 protein [uncultured Eubacterium sp.]